MAIRTLFQSETLPYYVCDHIPVPVLITRLADGLILYANEPLGQVFNIASADLTGRPILDFYQNPDDRQRLLDLLEQQEEVLNYEVAGRDVHGRPIWVALSAVRLLLEDMPALLIIFDDITVRKLQQERQREAEHFYQALAETSAALASTLDSDDVLDRILDLVNHLFPNDRADLTLIEHGRTYVVRSRGVQTDLLRNHMLRVSATPLLREMVETGSPVFVTDVLDDGRWVPDEATDWVRSCAAAPIRLDGQVVGFIHLNCAQPGGFLPHHAPYLQTFADQAAIALRNARQIADLEARVVQRTCDLEFERTRLHVILDASAEGIFYTEGPYIQYANSALCASTGYSPKELIGATTAVFRPLTTSEEDAVKLDLLLNAVCEGEVVRDEVKLRRKDGSVFDAGLTMSAVGSPDGPIVRAVTIVRDISREKALQQQQARFVANAAHELRTPVTNLLTRLYLMRRQPERLEEHLEILEAVGNRMRRLTEDLLDMSRFERGVIRLRPKPAVLQPLLDQLVRVQVPEAEAKEINLLLDLAEEPLTVVIDEDRFGQVITNLIVNALHYTPSAGRVVVTAGWETRDDERGVIITVQDSGMGIGAEHLAHIFQPFFRVGGGGGGSGLGLSIAREIVELHGGTIEVESEPGIGSLFRIRLSAFDAG